MTRVKIYNNLTAYRYSLLLIIIIKIMIIFIYRGLLIELSLICHEALFKMVHNVQITYHTSIDYQ